MKAFFAAEADLVNQNMAPSTTGAEQLDSTGETVSTATSSSSSAWVVQALARLKRASSPSDGFVIERWGHLVSELYRQKLDTNLVVRLSKHQSLRSKRLRSVFYD